MARVTDSEVKAIINTSVSDTTPFIIAASDIVSNEVAAGSSHDDVRLAEIERWLSAHLVAINDPDAGQIQSKQVGDVSVEYGRNRPSDTSLGASLSATKFGQQAIMLDTSGTLKRLSNGGKIGFRTINHSLKK